MERDARAEADLLSALTAQQDASASQPARRHARARERGDRASERLPCDRDGPCMQQLERAFGPRIINATLLSFSVEAPREGASLGGLPYMPLALCWVFTSKEGLILSRVSKYLQREQQKQQHQRMAEIGARNAAARMAAAEKQKPRITARIMPARTG